MRIIVLFTVFLTIFLFFFRECRSEFRFVDEFLQKYRRILVQGNSQELTEVRGFHNENHTVVTSDGYEISVFRILNPNSDSSNKPRYPILFIHGLYSDSETFQRNSDGFFLRNKNLYIEYEQNFTSRLDVTCGGDVAGRMLVYNLAACGYDVWITNTRDSPEYSRHRVYDSTLDPEYWNITLDSYVEDMRASFEYVLRLTESPTAGLFCHSASCGTALQLMIESPEYNQLIRPLVMAAPYVFNGDVLSTLLTTRFIGPILQNYLMPTFNFRDASVFVVNSLLEYPTFQSIYSALFTLLGGYSPVEYDWSRVDRIAAHIPGSSSSRVVAHLGQRLDRNNFARFDYLDPTMNLAAYGQISAPEHDLTKVTNKNMVLMTGLYDTISPYPSIEKLKKNLRVPFLEEIRTPNSHMDFLFGSNVNSTVNIHVLKLLRRLKL